MKTKYFNPNDPINKEGIEIDSDWPEEVQKMQREMALSRGFKKLVDVNKPDDTEKSMFQYSTSKIVESRSGDETVYVRKWQTKHPTVCLSFERFMDFLNRNGMLESTMRKIHSDEVLSDWLFNDRTYTRGTKKSAQIIKLLGLDVKRFEKLCEYCFEVRKPC